MYTVLHGKPISNVKQAGDLRIAQDTAFPWGAEMGEPKDPNGALKQKNHLMLFLVNMTNLLWSFEHSSMKLTILKCWHFGGPRGPNGAQNQKKKIDKIPGT